jgi:DNA-binding beta-propeller fold protein YncE
VGIALTPDGKSAYLINYGPVPRGPGTVTPVRLATGTVLPPIKVGSYPSAIAITPR